MSQIKDIDGRDKPGRKR